MGYGKFHYITPRIPYSQELYILDYKHRDINGDNIADDVYLVGRRNNFIKENFASDIALVFYDGNTNLYSTANLKFNYGYNSAIELQEVNRNIVNIIICIDSRDEKKIPFHYIYTVENNMLVKVYDYEEIDKSREANKKSIVIRNQGSEENNTQDIDFSDVQPMYSETVRDPKLEEAIRNQYILNEQGVRYYYDKIDLNDDGVPEIFVYLIGNTVCCQITGACQVAIFKVENGEYKILSKLILVNKPFVITEDRTNGYRDIILLVHGGTEGDFYVRLKYDGITYPSIPYLQPRVKSGAKIKGISVISDDVSKNSGITIF